MLGCHSGHIQEILQGEFQYPGLPTYTPIVRVVADNRVVWMHALGQAIQVILQYSLWASLDIMFLLHIFFLFCVGHLPSRLCFTICWTPDCHWISIVSGVSLCIPWG